MDSDTHSTIGPGVNSNTSPPGMYRWSFVVPFAMRQCEVTRGPMGDSTRLVLRRCLLLTLAIIACISTLQAYTVTAAGPVARIGQDTYASVQAAVDAASSGDIIAPVDREKILSESIDLKGKSVVLDGFVLSPTTGLAVSDQDGDSTAQGILRNVTVLRGGVSEIKGQNCVVFRSSPSFLALQVTDSSLTNCIVESGATTSGSSFVSSLTTWTQTSNEFVNLASGDCHIKSSASDAIGKGTAIGGWDSPQDYDGNVRPNGLWDIGVDEYYDGVGATVPLQLGRVTAVRHLGTRGTSSADFVYIVSQGGSGTSSHDDTLYAVSVDSASIQVVDQIQALAPILNMEYVVDNQTQGAAWRAWIFLILDAFDATGSQGQDGFGDSIQLIVDTGTGLEHPTQPVTDADPTNRRFGSVALGGGFVYRPGGGSDQYRIAWITLATVLNDGADNAPSVVHDNPSGTNRMRWGRLFFAAQNTNGTQSGALFKANIDPYDTTDGDNGSFGSDIWDLVEGESGHEEFDYSGQLAFASFTLKLFVPISDNPTPATQALMVRLPMTGVSDPVPEATWRGLEEDSSVDENNLGASVDSGGADATVTYAASDGTVVYNRVHDAADGAGQIRWGSKLPSSPTTRPQRFSSSAFTLVGVDGGVHKIWSTDSDSDQRNGALVATGLKVTADDTPPVSEAAAAATSDPDWPLTCTGAPIGELWERGARLFWVTDGGRVCDYTWDRIGTGIGVASDEVQTSGFPYVIPGGRISFSYVHPTGSVLVGTDEGVYRFEETDSAEEEAPTAVPTLAPWGLVILAALLATVVAWRIRATRFAGLKGRP